MNRASTQAVKSASKVVGRRPGGLTRLLLGGWLLATGASFGCVTSGEGDALKRDLADLRTRLDAIDKRDAEYKEQVVRLKKVLDEATGLLTRNSADVGARVAKQETDIAALVGRLEELQHNLDQQGQAGTLTAKTLEARLASLELTQNKIVDKVAPNLPEDKDQLWSQAGARVQGGQRDEGRRFYRSFIQRFPTDPRSPQAYLALGQSYVGEGKHANAAAEYQKILDSYPQSAEVPEAMWQLSTSFLQLKFCADAKALLSDLAKRYPKSPRANDARNELKRVGKLPRTACTS
jgi:TolA-binding protein